MTGDPRDSLDRRASLDDVLSDIGDVLAPDEVLRGGGRATDSVIGATDRRLLVARGNRLALDAAYTDLRRIQFDIERQRPATLVIVPERPSQEPQVLAIPHAEIPRIAIALGIVADRLARLD